MKKIIQILAVLLLFCSTVAALCNNTTPVPTDYPTETMEDTAIPVHGDITEGDGTSIPPLPSITPTITATLAPVITMTINATTCAPTNGKTFQIMVEKKSYRLAEGTSPRAGIMLSQGKLYAFKNVWTELGVVGANPTKFDIESESLDDNGQSFTFEIEVYVCGGITNINIPKGYRMYTYQ